MNSITLINLITSLFHFKKVEPCGANSTRVEPRIIRNNCFVSPSINSYFLFFKCLNCPLASGNIILIFL